MTASRDPDRMIHHFLLEGGEQLHDQVYDAVRAEIDVNPQRVFIGPWRLPAMNKLVPIGLGAAAVVGLLVIGGSVLRTPGADGPGVGTAPTAAPSATPEPSDAAPSASPTASPIVLTTPDDPVQVTVMATPGWVAMPQFDAVSKADDGLDAPESVGVALLAWAWPAGTGVNVYGDPCQWLTTIPASPATTPDEIAAAFAAQALTETTAPVDVTVGGFRGKAITLEVPMSFDLPNATREQKFADCDRDVYAFYGIEGEDGEARNAQGAGQIDELWILDVNGSTVILDLAYGPAVPADRLEELRALAASATFE